MSQPTADEIRRSLSDLRDCAKSWNAEADELGTKVEYYRGHLAGSGLAFGIFAGPGLAYQGACEAISDACKQGSTKLGEVGDTLAAVANAYEQDEQNNVHLAQGEW